MTTDKPYYTLHDGFVAKVNILFAVIHQHGTFLVKTWLVLGAKWEELIQTLAEIHLKKNNYTSPVLGEAVFYECWQECKYLIKKLSLVDTCDMVSRHMPQSSGGSCISTFPSIHGIFPSSWRYCGSLWAWFINRWWWLMWSVIVRMMPVFFFIYETAMLPTELLHWNRWGLTAQRKVSSG